MFLRPAAVAAVPVRDRFAARLIHSRAAARIGGRRGLRCERFASRGDRAQTMLAPCLRYARFAVASPALEHRLAAHRARGRNGRTRFDGRRTPRARCIRPRLRGLARRCEQRRSLWTGNATAFISSFSRGVRGAAPLLTSDLRNVCARRAATGRRHSRQCGSVSASSWVNGAGIRQTPFGSSPKSRALNSRSSKRSSRKASTSPRTPSIASSASASRLRWSACKTPIVGSQPCASSARRASDSRHPKR
jgi:hypothetical protein